MKLQSLVFQDQFFLYWYMDFLVNDLELGKLFAITKIGWVNFYLVRVHLGFEGQMADSAPTTTTGRQSVAAHHWHRIGMCPARAYHCPPRPAPVLPVIVVVALLTATSTLAFTLPTTQVSKLLKATMTLSTPIITIEPYLQHN